VTSLEAFPIVAESGGRVTSGAAICQNFFMGHNRSRWPAARLTGPPPPLSVCQDHNIFDSAK